MNSSGQPRHLTLTELVLNFALFCGVGAWLGGLMGAIGGGILISVAYARVIWVSIKSTPVQDHGSHKE